MYTNDLPITLNPEFNESLPDNNYITKTYIHESYISSTINNILNSIRYSNDKYILANLVYIILLFVYILTSSLLWMRTFQYFHPDGFAVENTFIVFLLFPFLFWFLIIYFYINGTISGSTFFYICFCSTVLIAIFWTGLAIFICCVDN